MEKFTKKIQSNIPFFLFSLSILFFKIPNFYLIPIIKNSFFTSQSTARILIICLFIHQVIIHFLKNKKLIPDDKKVIVNLVLVLFILQSLTVIKVSNIESFLIRFKEIIIGFISFFVFNHFRSKLRIIIYILYLSLILNFTYQFIMGFWPDFYKSILSIFIYDKHLQLVFLNLERGRLYTETYDEIIVPFLFLNLFNNKILNIIIRYLLQVIIIFLSFLSNWRIRILALVVGIIFSLKFIGKTSKKYIAANLSLLLIIAIFSHFLSSYLFGFSYIDRIFPESQSIEANTLNFRILQIKEGMEIGTSSILGSGLGNYFDLLPSAEKFFISVNEWQSQERKIASEYVHNIFASVIAESGLAGLFIFLIIINYFIKSDLKTLRSEDRQRKACIIAFWILFLFGLFNPPVTGTYQFLFWGFRGLLL